MDNKFFLHQIKKTGDIFDKDIVVKDIFDKGIVVKDTFEAAKQGYHAYLGAYAYGQSAETSFVSCMITDMTGAVLMKETWLKAEPEPEPEPEPNA